MKAVEKPIKRRGAPRGNQNAKKGKHPSHVLRLPVEIVDGLHDCLALDGELDTETGRVEEYALGILSGYIRRKIEESEAIIL